MLPSIEINPNLAEAYKSIGVVYAYKGKFHSAIEYYSKALELNPNFGAAINNIGSMYWWLGRYDEAYPWAVKSIQVDPARASGYSTLGLIYTGLALDSAAQKWFLTSIELQPILTREENLIKSYISTREYQKARNYIQNILKDSPGDNEILEVAGLVEVNAGDFPKAKMLYDSAYSKKPDVKQSSSEYAYVLWKMNKKKDAVVIFNNASQEAEEIIKQENEEFNSPYILAQINAVLGNKELAYKWLQQAINYGWRQFEMSLNDPLFENIRNEDRFKDMMNNLKSLVYSMRSRINEYK